jgi:hypothetical protein
VAEEPLGRAARQTLRSLSVTSELDAAEAELIPRTLPLACGSRTTHE